MSTSPTKILCIEDDPEVGALVAEDLRARGYEVHLARNGREGMQAMFADPPDLVLCDISMPVMSGFEVLETLTAIMPRFASVPFVFLTAFADRETELKGRALGADDYVTKPIDFDRLDAIIRARLARARPPEGVVAPVQLSEREIETLTWAARGKTSAEIAQIIGLTKATVDAHLDYARAKLGAATRTQAVVEAVRKRLIEP